jgi:hypothetical protein
VASYGLARWGLRSNPPRITQHVLPELGQNEKLVSQTDYQPKDSGTVN